MSIENQAIDFSSSSLSRRETKLYPHTSKRLCVLGNPSVMEVSQVLLREHCDLRHVLAPSIEHYHEYLRAASLTNNVFESIADELTIFTSGTSGTPKCIGMKIDQIFDSTVKNHSCKIWGLTYQPFRMAGLLVIAQSIASNSLLVVPRVDESPSSALLTFQNHDVQGLSATPSFFRVSMSEATGVNESVQFISLGGEVVDQRILDLLKIKFPNAKLTHIYATSETGSLFAVSDGFSGFPSNLVGRTLRNGKRVEVEEGQIVVFLPGNGSEELQKIFTGDLVEKIGNRWNFIGRDDEFINVGGTKVSLLEVELSALAFAGVRDAMAYSIPSPFLGEVVALQVVLDSPELHEKLAKHLREILPRVALPVQIEAVAAIKLGSNHKKKRKNVE